MAPNLFGGHGQREGRHAQVQRHARFGTSLMGVGKRTATEPLPHDLLFGTRGGANGGEELRR